MFTTRKTKDELAACQLEKQQANALLKAINSNMATIQFTTDGTITDANDLFLQAVNYSLEEVKGKHHRIFCTPELTKSQKYQDFWKELSQGKAQSGTFKRIKKSGEVIWLEATYFPIYDEKSTLTGFLKIAADVTAVQEKLRDQEALYKALDRSMAIIEFTPDGVIIDANKNFLSVLKYKLSDIKGQHHQLFCFDNFYQKNPNFWSDLKSGRFFSGQFERKDAHGNTIWIEASYNPILDDSGKVVKVIKFASDITAQVERNDAVMQVAQLSSATAEETSQIAEHGSNLLAKSVHMSEDMLVKITQAEERVEELNNQSQNIQKIVSTIRAIAEQTNLLALNAAIEAARAGEQGRGFAVVADEVRQLASRTSQSTAEINLVVSENEKLTAIVKEHMVDVKESAMKNNSQITEVSSVMNEINVGAQNVSATVAKIIT